MSRTLELVDRLLARSRHLQHIGREDDALALLTRLAAFRELPPEVAEEVQVRLGELQLRRRRYRRARRHLTAAVRSCPGNARSHYLLGRAISQDDRADPRRAVAHYRRSLEIQPRQPSCLCALGRLALRLGRRTEGLNALRRAAEMGGQTPGILRRVAAGLRLAGAADEARRLLRLGMFRHSRDPRFRQLWSDFQFEELRREQAAARSLRNTGSEDGPVLLAFERPTGGAPAASVGRRRIRRDVAATLPAPHSRETLRLPDQRHAQ